MAQTALTARRAKRTKMRTHRLSAQPAPPVDMPREKSPRFAVYAQREPFRTARCRAPCVTSEHTPTLAPPNARLARPGKWTRTAMLLHLAQPVAQASTRLAPQRVSHVRLEKRWLAKEPHPAMTALLASRPFLAQVCARYAQPEQRLLHPDRPSARRVRRVSTRRSVHLSASTAQMATRMPTATHPRSVLLSLALTSAT